MSVLVSGNKRVKQGELIKFDNTTQGKCYYSDKVFRKSKGKHYYEATHVDGSGAFHLFGFEFDNIGFISFYPWGNFEKPHFFGVLNNDFVHSPIPFSVDIVHTVGLGVDLRLHFRN